jgi:hypothetical protein
MPFVVATCAVEARRIGVYARGRCRGGGLFARSVSSRPRKLTNVWRITNRVAITPVSSLKSGSSLERIIIHVRSMPLQNGLFFRLMSCGSSPMMLIFLAPGPKIFLQQYRP